MESFSQLQDKIVMGTGHRPQDMPCCWEKRHPWKMYRLAKLMECLKNNRPKVIISGFALGWDSWLSYCAIKLEIELWAYIPFQGQESMWSQEQQAQYHSMLSKASKILEVCEPGYAPWKMHRRNEAMIRDSDIVLTLWNPDKVFGGTYSTIQAAQKKNKKILNFWLTEPKFVVY